MATATAFGIIRCCVTSTCRRLAAMDAGGGLVTKTLVISALSAGGSEGGPRLIARNKATGDIVGSVDLPSGAIGTPMTYILDGRQYLGLTIGGPRLIAFTLPQ